MNNSNESSENNELDKLNILSGLNKSDELTGINKSDKLNILKRINLLDTIRGVLIILVVAYHILYDLDVMFGVDIPFFRSSAMDNFRDAFVGVLILIAGISCNLSRSNLKRGIKTLLFGLVLTMITFVFMPENGIVFGILHFFGTSMIVYGLFEKLFQKIPAVVGCVCAAVFYLATYSLYEGLIGFGTFALSVKAPVKNLLFFILGFRTGHTSADYYPVFPWIFIFIAGTFAGRIVRKQLPDFVYKDFCPPLTWIGRHTLWIYLAHQPIVYVVLMAIFKII